MKYKGRTTRKVRSSAYAYDCTFFMQAKSPVGPDR